MFDVATYLMTQNNPGGPMIRPSDPVPHELDNPYDDELEVAAPSLGRTMGGLISLAAFVALGIYFLAAI
jgi:hypothetical protein